MVLYALNSRFIGMEALEKVKSRKFRKTGWSHGQSGEIMVFQGYSACAWRIVDQAATGN